MAKVCYNRGMEKYRGGDTIKDREAGQRSEEMASRQETFFGKIGKFVLGEKVPAFSDSGKVTLNKGELTGDHERKNEDAVYYNPEDGIFGVFDGAGGVEGGARASELASRVVGAIVKEKKDLGQRLPERPADLTEMLLQANDTVWHDTEAGISTATIGRVVGGFGGKKLIWASVGDSRIYLVRDGDAKQITTDEGVGNQIWNYLGSDAMWAKQAGEVPLKNGDNIVFCSDGVTGDFEDDFIPNREFAAIVSNAKTAEEAGEKLVLRATKTDDRTAVVVRI